MDFGFSTFLEKFEEKFGGKLSKILLGLIGFAVASVCSSLIYTNIIYPAYGIIGVLIDRDKSLELQKAISVSFNIFMVIIILMNMVTAYNSRKELKDAEKYRDEYQEYIEFVSDFYAYADSFFKKIQYLQWELKSKLTARRKKDMFKIAEEIESEVAEAKLQMALKVANLNSVINGDPIDLSDTPLVDDYDLDAVSRDPEDETL